MSYHMYQTAGDLINRVAIEVGLAKSTDPYSEQDPSFILLRTLMESCGDELLDEYDWQSAYRVKEYRLTNLTRPPIFLPEDFYRVVPQTTWEQNASPSGRPMAGPSSPQEWTRVENRNLSGDATPGYLLYRLMQNTIEIMDLTAKLAGADSKVDFSFEYISRFWTGAGGQQANRHYPEGSGDVVYYRPNVIKSLLKTRFLEARGFDSTKANDAYQIALEAAKGQEKGAPILNAETGRGHLYSDRLIDGCNAPDTGYGQP